MSWEARILADSLAPCQARLTTWVLTYPRMIHPELETHRELSRNSGSSRAIPSETMIKQVLNDPAMPIHWGMNQKGMQAAQELDQSAKAYAEAIWRQARLTAIGDVRELLKLGLHKQVANRMLEPWMWITTIVSSTDYANFFAQRDHPDAQPEFQHLAKMMRKVYDESRPVKLRAGDWHLPFFMTDSDADSSVHDVIKACTGRCARVSYLTHDGKRDIDADVALHDRLLNAEPKHMSPFEHCAMACDELVQSGNFKGWIQYRKLIPGEYKSSYPKLGLELQDGDVVAIERAYVVAFERIRQVDEALQQAEIALSSGCYDQARAFLAAAQTHVDGKVAA